MNIQNFQKAIDGQQKEFALVYELVRKKVWKNDREWRALVAECNRWAALRNDQSGETLKFSTVEVEYKSNEQNEEFEEYDEDFEQVVVKKKDVIVLRRCPIISPIQSIERLFGIARGLVSYGSNRNVEIHNQTDDKCCLIKQF